MTVVINGTTGIDTGTGSLIAADSTTATYLDMFEDTDNGSNYVRLIAPTSVAANRTITLPDSTGTVVVGSAAVSAVGQIPFSTDGSTYTPTAKIVSGTSVSASGTSVDFTGIPSWVKRITVMFSAMSTNGTSVALVQTGSGSFTTSGYASSVVGGANGNVVTGTTSTSGFPILGQAFTAASAYNGVIQLLNINGNTWVAFGGASISGSGSGYTVTGNIALGGTLDRVRLFIDGTQQFDAGTINILYE